MTGSRPTGRHAAPGSTTPASRDHLRRLTRSPRRAARPHSGAGRWFRRGAQLTAALLSTLIVVGTGWAWSELRSFQSNVQVGAPVVPADGEPSPTEPQEVRRDINILLLGNDSRAGASPDELRALGTEEDGGSANTDTMLLMHLPADGSRATAISFPRDSYVEIPGYGRSKLNSAYPDGYQTAAEQGVTDEVARQSAGIAVLTRTLQQLTGVRIDHYIQVNLLGFYRISLALQGVEVCLREPVQEANSGIDLQAGRQQIMGTQALAFVRQRYGFPDGRGDIDRIARQQYFLSAVLRKVLSAGTLLNPGKVSDLLDAVSSSLLIDRGLQGNQLLSLASRVADLSAGNVNFFTIPLEGEDQNDAGDVLLVDPERVAAFVQDTFDPPVASTPAPTTSGPSPATPGTGSATPDGDASTDSSSTATSGSVSATPSGVNAADAGCIY